MPDAHLLARVAVHRAVCHGRPHIRGTHIAVGVILNRLSSGVDMRAIVGEFPGLTEADVRACIAYRAWCLANRFVGV